MKPRFGAAATNMAFLRIAIAIALLAAAAPQMARADGPGRDAQKEVSHLLQYLEASKCAFYRNGTWHDSHEARVHLEQKYTNLKSGSGAISAEDFVARAATASSISGTPYLVRCDGKEPVASANWLEAELRRYRATSTSTGN
jgi:hypothetical protein